jgi:hypothetical protein
MLEASVKGKPSLLILGVELQPFLVRVHAKAAASISTSILTWKRALVNTSSIVRMINVNKLMNYITHYLKVVAQKKIDVISLNPMEKVQVTKVT